MEPPHTVLSVLRAAEGWLAARSVEAPKRSAELLLGSVLGLPRLQLYLQHDRPLDEHERAAMRTLLARRGKHEPVAYLLGEWSFRGHDLYVSPAVLVPRPETEELVGLALDLAPPHARVVDLGTGSGAIAVALALERPDVAVVATDLSRNALDLARRNVERHGVQERVELRCGSWWEPVGDGESFDLVVANPPYVDPRAPEHVDEAVRLFEPPLALYCAPGDPGSCYRSIATGFAAHLAPGGSVVVETGLGAVDAAMGALAGCPELCEARIVHDLSGCARFVAARRR